MKTMQAFDKDLADAILYDLVSDSAMDEVDLMREIQELSHEVTQLNACQTGLAQALKAREICQRYGAKAGFEHLMPLIPELDRAINLQAGTERVVGQLLDNMVWSIASVLAWMSRVFVRVGGVITRLLPFMEKYRDGLERLQKEVFRGTTVKDFAAEQFSLSSVRATPYKYVTNWFTTAPKIAELCVKFKKTREPEELMLISKEMSTYLGSGTGQSKLGVTAHNAAARMSVAKKPTMRFEEDPELPRMIFPMLQLNRQYCGDMGYTPENVLKLIDQARISLNNSITFLRTASEATKNQEGMFAMRDAYADKDPIKAKAISAKMSHNSVYLIEVYLCMILFRRFNAFYGGQVYRLAKVLADCKRMPESDEKEEVARNHAADNGSPVKKDPVNDHHGDHDDDQFK